MTQRLQWSVEQQSDLTVVTLSGSVDEDADFAALSADVKNGGALRFNLSGINRINSCGVREWVNFIRSLPANQRIELQACSPVVVSQVNMISNFVGAAKIVSVEAPFVCDACGFEQNVLVTIQTGKRPTLGEVTCPKCKAAMEFDDIEDSYFAFHS